jgi:hypothetical protein
MALDTILLVPKRTDTATVTITSSTAGHEHLKGVAQYWLDAQFTLIVTAAATDAADTMDLKIQHSHNSDDIVSSAWDDFVYFTQLAGNGGVKQYIAQWTRAVSPETEMTNRPSTSTISAGDVLQGPIGPDLRVVATLVDSGDANTSYTWKLIASVMHTK